jgi:CBS domain-containing protein/ribosome-associated translation inhibitor RaiA
MLVKDVMSKNLITTTPEETVSQAISKMRLHKIHQLPVLSGKELVGILTINKIISREVDPASTKVSALMTSTPSIKPDFTVEEAAELLINSNMRALPVVDRVLIGIVSESDLMKVVKITSDLGDVAKDCIYVNENNTVGDVKRIFSQKNVSRVPVIKGGKFIGVVGTLEMVSLLEQGKQKFGSGHRDVSRKHSSKEKMSFSEIPVVMAMRQPVMISSKSDIRKALSLLKENEEVLVEDGTPKIITPKDVLRMISAPKKQAYYQIVGLDLVDSTDAAKIQQTVDRTLKKLSTMAELQPLNVTIKTIRKQDSRAKYEIHAKLPTNIGAFVVSKVIGWNAITAMQEAMNNLEREIKKRYEKIKDSDRATRAYMRGK